MQISIAMASSCPNRCENHSNYFRITLCGALSSVSLNSTAVATVMTTIGAQICSARPERILYANATPSGSAQRTRQGRRARALIVPWARANAHKMYVLPPLCRAPSVHSRRHKTSTPLACSLLLTVSLWLPMERRTGPRAVRVFIHTRLNHAHLNK